MNPMDIVPHMWSCFFLAAFGILSIYIPFADYAIRKNPWKWEQ